MKLSTEKIISILPLDIDFKNKLQSELPKMDVDTRTEVEHILWRSFGVYYELKLQENIQQAIVDGDVHTDGTLYRRMDEKTMKDIEGIKQQSIDSGQLADVRQKLEHFINSTYSHTHE